MKTAEEIKRGLRVCDSVGRVIKAESWCKEKCPYMDEKFGCGQDYLLADALAYIKQLEAERDAAVDHVRGDCAYCTYLPGETIPYSCFDCANKGYYRWEFRGAQKEG